MSLPSEVTVFKGSPSGKVIKEIVKGRTSLLPNEVAIRMTHSGVCATDTHHLHSDLVLGHEGVGVVQAIGTSIIRFTIGDRIGFGYAKDGCGKCPTCLSGNSYPCEIAPRNFGAQDLDQGSFSTFSVWPETDLYKIPDALSSAEAAPLFCAGMTVFTPMLKFGVKAGDRVGIIGIGGLGHLAVQYAAKLGAEVVVFSGSADKEKEALALGAKEFFVTKDLADMKPEKKLDFLFITANGHPDWNVFLPFMKQFGQVILLGITTEPLDIPYLPFLLQELSFHGSVSSTNAEVQATLDFAAANGVKPLLEEFPMNEEGIAAAVEKLASGKMRYRGVLKV